MAATTSATEVNSPFREKGKGHFESSYYLNPDSFSFSNYNSAILGSILALNSFNYFIMFPKTTEWQTAMNDASADAESRATARKWFGAYHGISVLANFVCMAANVMFFHSATRGISIAK